MTILIRGTICLMLLTCGSMANAAIMYDFVFAQGSYSALPGEVVPVQVFLQETVTGGDTSLLGPGSEGLFGVGVRVFFNDAPLPSDPAKVLLPGHITPNPLFNDNPAAPSLTAGVSAQLVDSVVDPFDDVVFATQTAPGVYRALLGTFNFTAGSVLGETTSLRATLRDDLPNTIDNLTSFGTELDPLISNGLSSITVVPEPGSMALATAGILLLIATKKLRRNRLLGR